MAMVEEARSWIMQAADATERVVASYGLIWVVVFSIFVVLLLKYLLFPPTKSRQLPPGPPALPLIGHLHLMSSLPHHSLLQLATTYGPLFHVRLGSTLTVVAASAEMAREFLKTHDLVFASRPSLAAGKYHAYNYQDMAFAPYNEHYKTLRKLCTMELFTARRIASFRHHREEEISIFTGDLLEKCEQQEAITLKPRLFDLMVNIVTRAALSNTFFGPNAARGSVRLDVFKSVLEEYFRVLGHFLVGDYFPYLKWIDHLANARPIKKQAAAQDSLLQRILDERRHSRQADGANAAAEDFLDVLLSLSEKDQTNFLKDDIIKAVLNNVVEASTDTSAVVLEWAFTELLRHPLALEKAQKELDSVVGHDRHVKESDIPQLTYLQAIMKETLRLHPPGPMLIPHKSTVDCVVKGYFIPNNTNLFVHVYAIGRDAKIWENPMSFFPERFLESSIDLRGQDFELIPFGSGRRGCPGMSLGLLMVQITLARLLHAFHWSPAHGQQPEDIDVDETFNLAARKKNLLQAIISPRLPMSMYKSKSKSNNNINIK